MRKCGIPLVFLACVCVVYFTSYPSSYGEGESLALEVFAQMEKEPENDPLGKAVSNNIHRFRNDDEFLNGFFDKYRTLLWAYWGNTGVQSINKEEVDKAIDEMKAKFDSKGEPEEEEFKL